MLLGTLQHIAEHFSIPLAPKKMEGPANKLVFLSITIDSVAMECRLPENKLVALRGEVNGAASRRKIQLQELQSLPGKLNFACRIIPMGRIFCGS